MDILARLHEKLFPYAESLRSVPQMSIGGRGGWKLAIGSSMALDNAFGEAVTTYCILDSDYHTSEERQQKLDEAQLRDVSLHIWNRKEIENYLLVPATIARYISKRVRDDKTAPDATDIEAELLYRAENKKEDIFDNISSQLQSENRGWQVGRANKEARKLLTNLTKQPSGILAAAPGKKLLSELSQWTADNFGVGLSHNGIAAEMRADEIDLEVKKVLELIEARTPFSNKA